MRETEINLNVVQHSQQIIRKWTTAAGQPMTVSVVQSNKPQPSSAGI